MNIPQDFSFKKDYVNRALNEFTQEKSARTDYLKDISDAIRDIENSLRDDPMALPFRFIIEEEAEDGSLSTTPEKDQFNNLPYTVISYRKKKRWSLCWEKDSESKKFRLLFLEEMAEIVYFYDLECQKHFENQLPFKELLKIPFIGTKLQIRLKYAKFLHTFVLEFKNYLKEFYVSVQEGNSTF